MTQLQRQPGSMPLDYAGPDPLVSRKTPRQGHVGRSLLKLHTGLVFFYLYAPIAILVALSFNKDKWTIRWEGFTLAWYKMLWHDQQVRDATLNSLIVAVAATAIATLIGTFAGIALGRYRFRGKTATQGLLYLPLIIPEIVLGVALATFFGVARLEFEPQTVTNINDWLSAHALGWIGFSGEIGLELGLITVIIAHVVFSVSYVTIIVRARMAGLDRSLLEAASDLGAGPIGVFFRVLLPMLLPGIVAAALLVFTISLDDYLITSFVAGVGSTTLPLKIYSMVKVPVTAEVNAISTMLLIFTVVLILIAQLLLREPSSSSKKGRNP